MEIHVLIPLTFYLDSIIFNKYENKKRPSYKTAFFLLYYCSITYSNISHLLMFLRMLLQLLFHLHQEKYHPYDSYSDPM